MALKSSGTAHTWLAPTNTGPCAEIFDSIERNYETYFCNIIEGYIWRMTGCCKHVLHACCTYIHVHVRCMYKRNLLWGIHLQCYHASCWNSWKKYLSIWNKVKDLRFNWILFDTSNLMYTLDCSQAEAGEAATFSDSWPRKFGRCTKTVFLLNQ